MKSPAALLFLAMALSSAPALAGLEWDAQVLELRAQPGDKSVAGTFRYRNTGDRPVRIQRVINSCGCTSSKVSATTVSPGQRGELAATFSVGSRRGLQSKAIEVRTDDGESHRLGLRVHIEEIARLDPSVLFWRKGDAPGAKTIRLEVVRSEPVRILRAEVSEPGFEAVLRTVREGREYFVQVTPTDTGTPRKATLFLVSDEPRDNPQAFYARLRIR